jgi:hypothetical protein
MRYLTTFLFLCLAAFSLAQPKTNISRITVNEVALPAKVYSTMRDSCTQLDIVFLTGKGGSMSLDGMNIKYFTQFVTQQTTSRKVNATQDGYIMWQINGREYQSGKIYFQSDSSGYITFSRNDKEYTNALSPQGAGFLRSRGGK